MRIGVAPGATGPRSGETASAHRGARAGARSRRPWLTQAFRRGLPPSRNEGPGAGSHFTPGRSRPRSSAAPSPPASPRRRAPGCGTPRPLAHATGTFRTSGKLIAVWHEFRSPSAAPPGAQPRQPRRSIAERPSCFWSSSGFAGRCFAAPSHRPHLLPGNGNHVIAAHHPRNGTSVALGCPVRRFASTAIDQQQWRHTWKSKPHPAWR